ncbi:MAG TPA: sugar transferase [Bacillota bacterium]
MNHNNNIGFLLTRLAGDILLINGAILLAFGIRFLFVVPEYNFRSYQILWPIISILGPLLFGFFGLYRTENRSWTEVMASIIVSLIFLTLILIATSYMIGVHSFPRSVFATALLLQMIILGIWRWFMLQWEAHLAPMIRILIIAPLAEAGEIFTRLVHDNYFVIGVIVERLTGKENVTPFKLLGEYRDIPSAFDGGRPDTVVISSHLPEAVKNLVALNAMRFNIPVVFNPGPYEIMVSQSKIEQIQDTMSFVAYSKDYPGREQLKRILDLGISLGSLILCAPFMILIIISIKLSSPGPIFFKQERIGLKGRRFQLYKFRTMIPDAERETGPILASSNDPRVTQVGKLLRAMRLDELPQLFNVIKGDMSIVGPRPERPYFVKLYETQLPQYHLRHLIKPGITGLAQISGRYSMSAKDKLQYDLLYMKNATILLDLKIILQTIKVVLIPEKAS